jgi:hypothetical protein
LKKRLEQQRKMGDIWYMNEFLRGMATIGELFPPSIPFNEYPPLHSEWQGVANSFSQVGTSLWFAMKEVSKNAQRESKQAK